jgi:hypothetical protein
MMMMMMMKSLDWRLGSGLHVTEGSKNNSPCCAAGARNIGVGFADVTHIRREYLTHISLVPVVSHLRILLHVISPVWNG